MSRYLNGYEGDKADLARAPPIEKDRSLLLLVGLCNAILNVKAGRAIFVDLSLKRFVNPTLAYAEAPATLIRGDYRRPKAERAKGSARGHESSHPSAYVRPLN